MKRTWFAGVAAASILLAGLAFLPDMGFAQNAGGGRHGGGGGQSGAGGQGGGGHGGGGQAAGRGGGGRGGAGVRATGRGGGGQKSFAGSRGSGNRSVNRVRGSRTSKGVAASRRTTIHNTQKGLASRRGQGRKTNRGAVAATQGQQNKQGAITANQGRQIKQGGVAANPKANRQGNRSLDQLTANKSLRQASFSKHNVFYDNNKFGNADRKDHGRDDRWRDGSGRWYGYRWAGAVFWPYAFGDYFSYAMWPDDYSDSFWGYGPDALLWGTFWPYGEFAGETGDVAIGSRGDIYNREPALAAKAPAATGMAELAQTCGGFAPGVSDLPIQSLEKIAGTAGDDRAALRDLQDASAKASDILKQSCSSETPLTPVARLDAMQHRLQAMEQAGETVRGPLLRFYGSLTDDQRQRLNALANTNAQRRSKTARADSMDISALCTSQAEFTNVPTDEIGNTVSLDGAQKQQLAALKAASALASDELKGSCPSAIPNTVDGRLDAAQKRVTALIQAVNTIRPAVRDFFASLTDEQKATLNMQAEAPKKSASKD